VTDTQAFLAKLAQDMTVAVIAAAAAGKSLNEWIVGAIRDAAESNDQAA